MAMLLSELAGGAVPPGLGRVEITGLTSDSREVAPGYLFAALPGTQVDGAKFIGQAIAAGAAAILGPKTLPPGIGGSVPVLREDNPRKALALMAARFAGHQPETVVAVTGTNGKTSVAAFVHQIWNSLGLKAASMGTTGIVGPTGVQTLVHTTPEPVALHEVLDDLERQGVTHLALEASSHGLQQNRLDGVRIAAGAFTNLTRDHLDYHANFDEYFAAKMRLFDELLAPGAAAVINADMPGANRIVAKCKENSLRVVTTGKAGGGLSLISQKRDGFGQALKIGHAGKAYKLHLPLVGAFQASNALIAAGLVIATGGDPVEVFAALSSLEGARGRLELVAKSARDAPVFVDYAHTPDALDNALQALRPYADKRLLVVFGCGGDRDPGKRPQMGAIAAQQADVCYVTDDNPRNEDPAAIRAQIIAQCPDGIEVDDRADAIERAIAGLKAGDVLLVAGKGHETGQIVGSRTIPFSDHDVVLAATSPELPNTQPLWTVSDLAEATGGEVIGDVGSTLNGVSIDSRTLAAGDVFVAIKGEHSDGHDYVSEALQFGAGIAVVSHETADMTSAGALLVVGDTLRALGDIGRAARARSAAKIIAVTGSVGKTTTKEALRLSLAACAPTHASPASYNNHWGVPLSLARMPHDTAYGIFEIGMSHAGEITPLTQMARPHVAIVTGIAESHLGHFASLDEIADAKAEIFAGVEPGGAAVIVRDSRYYGRLAKAARAAGIKTVVGFGRHGKAQVRLLNLVLHSTCSCVTAKVFGEEVCFKVGVAGEHVVMNALGVLAAVKVAGGDLAKAAIALARLSVPKGRGVRSKLRTADGNFILIDESYNANPASMRAALALLAQLKPHGAGRRIAVLGDMLELGDEAGAFHADLAGVIEQSGASKVFVCGEQMARLWQALPKALHGHYAETSEALCEPFLAAIRAGDVVVIKGSLGSRMGLLVEATRNRFKPAADPHSARLEAGDTQ